MATKKKNVNTKKTSATKMQPKETNIKVTEEPERIIKPKNYIILVAVFIVTFIAVILLRNWYIAYRDYQLTIPVLKDKLNEVTIAELDTYLIENTDAILYIEVSEDENSREVADDLYDIVKERELTERVVYMNISSIQDKEVFFEDFNNKYNDSDEELTSYPALVLFYEGKIEKYVSRTANQSLNIGDIEQLFDEYELEGE